MHESQVQRRSHYFISLIYIAFSDLPISLGEKFSFSVLETSNPSEGEKSLHRS